MALILLGLVASDIRGSVGGSTYARNRSGAYVRNRTVPTNAPSARRTNARIIVSQLQTTYRVTLTAAQRTGWLALAAATLFPNALGQPHHLTAQNLFIRTNSMRLQHGQTVLNTAPVAPAIAPPPELTTALGVAPAVINISLITPVVAAGEFLAVQVSAPLSQGVNFFKGPWGPIQSFDSTDLVPQIIVTTANYVAAARYHYVYSLLDAVGRLSSSFYGSQDT